MKHPHIFNIILEGRKKQTPWRKDETNHHSHAHNQHNIMHPITQPASLKVLLNRDMVYKLLVDTVCSRLRHNITEGKA